MSDVSTTNYRTKNMKKNKCKIMTQNNAIHISHASVRDEFLNSTGSKVYVKEPILITHAGFF